MLKNYLKVAFINMIRNKFFTIINILGLALGITCCLLILFYVYDELSYDQYHTRANDIYRVNLSIKWDDTEGITSSTPPPVAGRLMQDYPEVETATRIFDLEEIIVRHHDSRGNEQFFSEKQALAVDSNFLKVFTFKVLEGNAQSFFKQPDEIVLTKKTAQRYFGDQTALGKILLLGNQKNAFVVAGVIDDIPENSHFHFDLLTSIPSYQFIKQFEWSWVWMQMVTYVVLHEGASPSSLENKFPEMISSHAPATFERIGMTYDEFLKDNNYYKLQLQPLKKIHLYSKDIQDRLAIQGNIHTIIIFSIIASFILLIACINFMNFSTARSSRRAKEVGIRKTLGSPKRWLVMQFLLESTVYTFLAMILALGLTEILEPHFNQLTGKSLNFSWWSNSWLALVVISFPVIVGLLAGSYPALYLTSFKPAATLKGTKINTGKHWTDKLRSGLVVTQFAISTGLIICSIIVFQQLRFISEKKIGFDKENLLVIERAERLGNNSEAFKNELNRQSFITSASMSSSLPSRGNFTDFYFPEGRSEENIPITSYVVDEEFLTTMDMQLLSGRGFSKKSPANAKGVILNETAVRQIGWDYPIGKKITYPGFDNNSFEVIGIVKDFNFMSLHNEVEPFAFFHWSSGHYKLPFHFVAARVQPGELAKNIKHVESIWKKFAPDYPFQYSFIDQDFDKLFRAEQRLGKIMGIFTGIAILIACLGLLGLVAYTIEQRTKEIGIRKVLGASVRSVILLLSKDFARLIFIAYIIAVPITYYMMSRWLEDFAYRIEIGAGIFIIAGTIAVIIAWLTISIQSIKAALANPVKSLRSE